MYSQTPDRVACSAPTSFPGAGTCPPSRRPLRAGKRNSLAAATGESAPSIDRVVTLEPALRPPQARDLAWLGEADRYLLDKLLREPFTYVDHPLFHEPQAEPRLFGGPAQLVRDATWFAETQQGGPAEPGGALLDGEAERLLFQRFNYARMRVADLLNEHRERRLSRRTIQLVLGWLHRALMIRGRLAQANIPLVISMARRPQFAGLDANEVMSAGNYALLRSIDRFDWSRGYKFSTYACQGILQRILHVVDATRRYRTRFVSEFDQTLERDDSAARRHLDQEQEWIDDLRDILSDNRAGLTNLERVVVQHRFGLPGSGSEGNPMTLKEIGELMGVTKERIRQVQKRALDKLRLALQREQLAA